MSDRPLSIEPLSPPSPWITGWVSGFEDGYSKAVEQIVEHLRSGPPHDHDHIDHMYADSIEEKFGNASHPV
jgi:hypothetical protein